MQLKARFPLTRDGSSTMEFHGTDLETVTLEEKFDVLFYRSEYETTFPSKTSLKYIAVCVGSITGD